MHKFVFKRNKIFLPSIVMIEGLWAVASATWFSGTTSSMLKPPFLHDTEMDKIHGIGE